MTKTNVEKIFNLVAVMSAYCFKNMLLAGIHQVMGESVHPNGVVIIGGCGLSYGFMNHMMLRLSH